MLDVIAQDRPDTVEPASPKRRAILGAAARLFMAEGYGAVSMDAVARAAGVSKATLYAHFGAKDRLFAAIITEACETMRSVDVGDDRSDLPLREALTRVGRQWLRFLLNDQAMSVRRTVVAEGHKFPELAHAFYDSGPRVTRAWLADWVAREVARGRLACPEPERAAGQFIALLTSDLVLPATLGIGPRADDAAIEQSVQAAVDTFCRAFATEGA
ncbi:MAG: TetR/AcrR family transcriptional regulator [Acetobacteraceae bacterium]